MERVASCISAQGSIHQKGRNRGRSRSKDRELARKRKHDAVENIGPNGDGQHELRNGTKCVKPCVKQGRAKESILADIEHYSRKVREGGESLSVRNALR